MWEPQRGSGCSMGPWIGWFAFEKHIPGELFTRNLLTLERTVPPGGAKPRGHTVENEKHD